MSNRHRRLSQQERERRAIARTAKQERREERKHMGQQVVQLRVMAEVVVTFKGEGKALFGDKQVFKQCGITSEGPFLKIVEVNEEVHLIHYEMVARVDTLPATIAPAMRMPD